MNSLILIYAFIFSILVNCNDLENFHISSIHDNDFDIYIVVLKNNENNQRIQNILDNEKKKSLLKSRILPKTLHIHNSKGFKGFSIAIKSCKESKNENGVVFMNEPSMDSYQVFDTKDIVSKREIPKFLSFLESIKNDIHYIEKDENIHLSYMSTNNSEQSDKLYKMKDCSKISWNLDKIRSKSWYGDPACLPYNALGDKVIIYLMDTGCNVNHEEFDKEQIIHCTSIVEDQLQFVQDLPNDHNDPNGHGTHICGILIGKNHGIAKRAKIVSVKIFRSDGETSWSIVLQGFSWICEYAKKSPNNRHIINLSFNGRHSNSALQKIKDMYENDFLIFVAAGNQDQDACYKCPAKSDHVITVGAVDQYGYRCYFSNYGKCIDLFAPGQDIVSADISSVSSTISLSGTSMACPHVAACAAVAWSNLFNQSSHVIKCILFNACTRGILSEISLRSPNLFLYHHMTENADLVSQCISQELI